MLVLCLWLMALSAHAAVLHHKPRVARPGNPVIRQLMPTSTGILYTNTTSSSVSVSSPSTSAAPELSVANRVASDCTPTSLCFDGRSCGVRYGGCYDINYCDGNTSPFPIPTCDPEPGKDLTLKRMAAKPQAQD